MPGTEATAAAPAVGRFARAYARIRNSKAFALGLATFIAIWVAFQAIPFLPHFDADFGKINFILSVEASLVGAITLAGITGMLELLIGLVRELRTMLHRQDVLIRQQLILTEAVRDTLLAQADE